MLEQNCSSKKVLAALVPRYHSVYGNATEVIYLDREPVLVPRTVKTVLKNTAKEYAIDLRALKEKYCKLLGCARSVPVPLDRETILIPLKMRRVISKNDSARGYVNCFAIKHVKEKESGACLVILRDDRTVECLHSLKSLKQHMSNCHFVHREMAGAWETGGQNADEYLNCPATKSDIAMLLKEIRELREKM